MALYDDLLKQAKERVKAANSSNAIDNSELAAMAPMLGLPEVQAPTSIPLEAGLTDNKLMQESLAAQPEPAPVRSPAQAQPLTSSSNSSENRVKTSISGTIPQSDKAEGSMTAEERLEKMMGELNEGRKKEVEDAQSRKFKADIFKIIGDNAGGIIGGAQAMNTKAAINPIKTQGYDVGDLVGQVNKRFDGDREALMDQYKQLLGARDRSENRKFQQDTLNVQKQGLALKEKALDQKGKGGNSEFDKAQQKKLGASSADYFTQDRDQLVNNSSKLSGAIDLLNKPNSDISGAGKGLIPDTVRSFTNPEAMVVQETIQSAITDTLRPTLGAQFTEGEGKRIMSLQYNPNLSPAENSRRAKELQTYINKKVQATDALYEHLGQGQPINTFNFKKYGMQQQGSSSSSGGWGGETPQASSGPYGDEVVRGEKTYKWNAAAGKYQLK